MRKLGIDLTTYISIALFFTVFAAGQSDTRQLQPLLAAPVQSSAVTEFQLRQYLMKQVAPVSVPKNAQAWEAEARRIRAHLLDEVIFHGWPKEWVNAQPRFENVGSIETGSGTELSSCVMR